MPTVIDGVISREMLVDEINSQLRSDRGELDGVHYVMLGKFLIIEQSECTGLFAIREGLRHLHLFGDLAKPVDDYGLTAYCVPVSWLKVPYAGMFE